jgi:L-lysine exporter family protein LysE/ArgO
MSLIVAIGAQNAFVLRQGVRRDSVLAVVALCALSDAVLIALGVGGLGALVVAWPAALTAVAWIGGAFLVCYGLLAARRVLRPAAEGLRTDGEAAGSRRRAVLTCLALTWLNPHVYLDTVFLLGSVAADRGDLRWVFALGAVLASLCWFSALGFGARLLGRWLARPAAWRVLDALVAVVMITLGVLLIAGG